MDNSSSLAGIGPALIMNCHPTMAEMTQLISRVHDILQWTRQNLVLTEDRKSFRIDQENYRTYQKAVEQLMRITEGYFTS